MEKVYSALFQYTIAHYYEFGPEDMRSDILAQLPWINNSRLAYDFSTKIGRILLETSTLAVFRDVNYFDLLDSFKSINITVNGGLNPNKILSMITLNGHSSAILLDKNDSTSITKTSGYKYDFGSTGHQQGKLDGYFSFMKADICHVNWQRTAPKKSQHLTLGKPSFNFTMLREKASKEALYETEYTYLINHINAQHAINTDFNVDFILSDEEYSKLEKKLFDIYQKCESGELGYSLTKNIPNTENCVSSLNLLSNVIGINNTFHYFTDLELNGQDMASKFAFYTKYMGNNDSISFQIAKSYIPQNILNFANEIYETYPTLTMTSLAFVGASIVVGSLLIALGFNLATAILTSSNDDEFRSDIIKTNFILVHPRHTLGDQCFSSNDNSALIALEILDNNLLQTPVKKKDDGLFISSSKLYSDCNEEASDRENEEQFGGQFCLASNIQNLYYTDDALEI